MSTTGRRIKERRQELGLSAEELAAKVDISPATIYRYENGQIDGLPINKLLSICKVLNASPMDFIDWDERKDQRKKEMESVDNMIDELTARLERIKERAAASNVTDEEAKLLAQYRLLSDVQKIKVQAYIEGLLAGV